MQVHLYSTNDSANGTGIHTSGIVGFAFATLDQVTAKAQDLYQSMKEMVTKVDFANALPSLNEQYELLLKRYEPGHGSPGCEFISYPGFLSQPSKAIFVVSVRTKNANCR